MHKTLPMEQFYVEGNSNLGAISPKPYRNPIVPEKDYLFAYDKHELYVPKKAFYQTVDLAVEERKDTLLLINSLPSTQRI